MAKAYFLFSLTNNCAAFPVILAPVAPRGCPRDIAPPSRFTLLDLKTEISEQARDKIHRSRPPLLLDRSKINNIKVGNILDNFDEVKEADW